MSQPRKVIMDTVIKSLEVRSLCGLTNDRSEGAEIKSFRPGLQVLDSRDDNRVHYYEPIKSKT